MVKCTDRFGQATLVHVPIAGRAPLAPPAGQVHGAGGAGHPPAVGGAVGRVVGGVGVGVDARPEGGGRGTAKQHCPNNN